ncbi:MAG: hypothetical protein K9K39_04655 [Desulfohalobiaceae bacterium]|nr:hypothetical protein [Desulfohalobiaceae bacterium]
MKYIIFEDFSGKQTPILFPERILHEELREQIPYAKVLSAGYVYLTEQGMFCQGKVTELGASAREEDSRIITQAFSRGDDSD